MTEEEKEIASSTPSSAPPAVPLPSATKDSISFVKGSIEQHKVAIFSLQYCEFCWTITQFFDKIKVPYTQINIDSFEYAKDNMGNKYRAALTDLTACNTFPQCFINGQFIGGAADACIKWKKGELQDVFKKAGVEYDTSYEGDPFEFLPKWVSMCVCYDVLYICSLMCSPDPLLSDEPKSSPLEVKTYQNYVQDAGMKRH